MWSSLFTTKWAAFGTFVSFVIVILQVTINLHLKRLTLSKAAMYIGNCLLKEEFVKSLTCNWTIFISFNLGTSQKKPALAGQLDFFKYLN